MRLWVMLLVCPLLGHDIITTRITWAREISRIVHHRCAACHRPGSTAAPMSLLTYDDARPWARAIAEEVLERRMPPWNPVKGFGEFKHEAGLNQEEIGLIADWVEGGAPLGEERYLPPNPLPQPPLKGLAGTRFRIADRLVLSKPLAAQGISVLRMPEGAAVTIWAELPDGAAEPLLEIASFRAGANQPYEFARALLLPAGTKLHVEGDGTVSLISSGVSPARQSVPSAPRPPAAPAATRGARRAAEKSR
jgi:hypothetical protein